jgi:hypothetical protein
MDMDLQLWEAAAQESSMLLRVSENFPKSDAAVRCTLGAFGHGGLRVWMRLDSLPLRRLPCTQAIMNKLNNHFAYHVCFLFMLYADFGFIYEHEHLHRNA